jgi:hypothetical protein
MVDVVAQYGLGLIEQNGGFLGAACPFDHFLQEVGVVPSGRLDEKFARFCALCSLSVTSKSI